MALWAGAIVVLPVGAAIAAVAGAAPPIGFWLTLAVAGAIVTLWQSGGRDRNAPEAPLLLLAGAAALVKVALVYSSESHWGALGLDTHQHIYWTKHVLDAGYVPLSERGSEILALYPRGFHLLTALWCAAGIGDAIGPWVKLMPFLQSWLACLAFGEMTLAWARNGEERSGRLAEAAVAIGLVAYAFALSRMVFPEHDLSGTPRYGAGAVFFFPLIAWSAGRALPDRRLELIAFATLPLWLMMLLWLNAILFVQAFVFLLPVLWVVVLLSRSSARPAAASMRVGVGALGVSSLAALGIALEDPWIISQWSPALLPAYPGWFGVTTPSEAAAMGILSPDRLVEASAFVPQYASIGAWLRLGLVSIGAGFLELFASGASFPFAHDLSSDIGRVALRGVLLVCVVAALLRRREAHARYFLALALACVVGAWLQFAWFEFSEGLAIGRDYAFELLRRYSGDASKHVGLPLLGMLLAAGLASAMRGRAAPAALHRPAVAVLAAIVLALALAIAPFALHGTTETVDPERGFWAPIDRTDIAALERIEARVEAEAGVLVPAAAWEIGEERWVIPQGPTAAVLPFATKRMIFNARLGPSVFYNWEDLTGFCQGTALQRRAFLEAHDVRWFLLRSEAPLDRTAERFRMCKRTFAELGVVSPPEHVEGNLRLYRIDPTLLR